MKRKMDDLRSILRSVPPMPAALLILSVVGMNLLANKSIDTGLDWLALDCGILFSWLTFLTMDILTQSCGPKAATAVSLTALGLNLFMALLFFLGSRVPGVWGESFVEGSGEIINAALNNTFGGTWYIILGSSVAFAVSAVCNNFLNFALRAYVSTFLAQFADNLIFALLVSRIFFGWTMVQCLTCALTGAVLELLFEVVFSPLGYRFSRGILERGKGYAGVQEDSL